MSTSQTRPDQTPLCRNVRDALEDHELPNTCCACAKTSSRYSVLTGTKYICAMTAPYKAEFMRPRLQGRTSKLLYDWETTVWFFWNNYKCQTTPFKRLHDALTYTVFDRIKYYRLNNWISNQDMRTFHAAAVHRPMINKSLLKFLFSLDKKYVYCFCKALTIEYTKVRENCRFWMKKGWHCTDLNLCTDHQYPIVLL